MEYTVCFKHFLDLVITILGNIQIRSAFTSVIANTQVHAGAKIMEISQSELDILLEFDVFNDVFPNCRFNVVEIRFVERKY
jgi:hypothetical protein